MTTQLEQLLALGVQDSMQKAASANHSKLWKDYALMGEGSEHIGPIFKAYNRLKTGLALAALPSLAAAPGPVGLGLYLKLGNNHGIMNLARKVNAAKKQGLINTALAGTAGLGAGALLGHGMSSDR